MTISDIPRADLDVIDGAGRALAVLGLAVSDPPAHETLAILLDGAHVGRGLLQVHHTVEPDCVLGVLDTLAAAAEHQPDLAAVVLASVRPGVAFDDPCDVDRWLEMSEVADEAGIELLEWFVIGGATVSCPRDLLGEPPRW